LKIENKLLIYLFLIPVMGMLIGMLGGAYLIKYAFDVSKHEGAQFLKQREIDIQKQKLKLLVSNVIDDIERLHLNEKNVVSTIRQLYPPRNNNYIFIYKVYNINGGKNFARMILNSNRKDIEGKIITDDYKDIHGFAFRKKMLELIRKHGEAFITYYYKKPNTNKIVQKMSYFVYYKPLNLIIASGVYLDDIKKVINEYYKQLDSLNINIMKKFIIISAFIFILTLIFTIFIAKIVLKEFSKFRKTIALNEKKLKYKLYVDELTKLKSRKSLMEDIENERFEYLAVIDIDNFRNINQFFGSEFGDKYLISFGNILKEFRKGVRESFSIYRIGADEFAIGLKHIDENRVYKLSEKLLEFVHLNKIHINDEALDIDITIAFSSFPNPLRKALITLREAKDKNKSILAYKDIKDENKEKEFFEIKKMLKTALKENQITPYIQPIVNSEKEIIKYEMLMRIVTPEKVIPPYFLDYAKQTKLYTQISSVMFKKCFEFIKETDILCSINIDMQDIENDDIVEQLKFYMLYVNKPVVFEILESESFKNYDKLHQFVHEFRQYGALIAIDDFGSGYSNYSEILELRPNYLKLDGSLIKNVNKSKANLVLIESILFLTKMMGIKTTAEFVEDESIFKKLRALGIDEFQGYYFSKPKPLSEIKEA